MHRLIYPKVKNIIFLGLIILMGNACASIATDYRREGFNLTQQSFEFFKQDPDLYEVVEIKNIKVYIVGDRKHFKWEKAAAYGSPVLGYAATNNEIYVFGKRAGDKIIVNQAILGHELNHLLNFKEPQIANPDNLNRLEFCHFKDDKPKECAK